MLMSLGSLVSVLPLQLLLLAQSLSAGWTGPRLVVEHRNGVAQLQIDGVAHATVWPNLAAWGAPKTQPAAGSHQGC
jgi:hypothetical protein